MRKEFRFRLYMICLLTVIVAGCKVKKPDGVLPESTMENFLYDYHIAKAMGENLPYSENYKKVLYTDAVFNKYGTTEAVFDSSMVWYTRNTEILSKIYERVNSKLKDQQNAINHLIAIRDKKPMTSAPGDSINVWAWRHMIRLAGLPMSNKFTFTLPSDSNFKERDTLVWEVNFNFPGQQADSVISALMAMQIKFENDSIIGETKEIIEAGTQSIRLQSDSLGAIKEINGFIYYPRGKSQRTLLADRISLMRYHSNDSLRLLNDSLQNDTLKADSGNVIEEKQKSDSAKTEIQEPQRLSPEEMNRRRTKQTREVKPEQLEVEQHIQKEKRELQQEKRINQRQRVQSTSRN